MSVPKYIHIYKHIFIYLSFRFVFLLFSVCFALNVLFYVCHFPQTAKTRQPQQLANTKPSEHNAVNQPVVTFATQKPRRRPQRRQEWKPQQKQQHQQHKINNNEEQQLYSRSSSEDEDNKSENKTATNRRIQQKEN